MKKLLNTLYVTSENSYLGLDGENIVVLEEQKELGRIPLHNLERNRFLRLPRDKPCADGRLRSTGTFSLCYLTPQGKFLARVSGRDQEEM